MSVEAISWAIDFEVAGTGEKAILMILANWADGEGVCFPGQQSIAQKACCSPKTVQRVLDRLEADEIIERRIRRRRDGSRTSDEIVLKAFVEAQAAAGHKPRKPLKTPQAAKMTGCGTASGQSVPRNQSFCPSQPDRMTPLTTFDTPSYTKEETSPPNPPPGGDQGFDEAWRAYPQDGRAVSNPDRARQVWAEAVAVAGSAPALQAAVVAYARWVAARVTPIQPPAFHRWLADRRFEAWLAPKTGRPAPTVPVEVRAAVARETTEGFAQSYLDPSRWDAGAEGGPRLWTANPLAARRLSDLACLKGVRIAPDTTASDPPTGHADPVAAPPPPSPPSRAQTSGVQS